MKKQMIAALILASFSGMSQAAGDAEAGANKVALCGSCHGMDGNSLNPIWPKLAGQSESYLIKQIKDFKSGGRNDQTMSGMAATIQDGDIEDIAAFYAGQEISSGEGDAEKIAAGKGIFLSGIPEKGVAACMACHGPNGSGNPAAGFPALKGQHAPYVTKAMLDFRLGTRANDPGKMMRDIAAKMSDAEMEAVADYIVSMK